MRNTTILSLLFLLVISSYTAKAQQHSDKTTEIYTRIATNSFKTIKNHLD